MPPKPSDVIVFAPHLWGQVESFSQLHGRSHHFTQFESRFVGGVSAHFNKAMTLIALAHRLKPNLAIDQRELEERGHTPALNSTELAAVIEAAILELYSSIDCAAHVVITIYKKMNVRGLKVSTRNLFEHFENLAAPFPEEIKSFLRSTQWFSDLRSIRDELTHRQTGSCRLDNATGKIFYMHNGMQVEGRAKIIDDIFAWIDKKCDSVNSFLGKIYHYLNGQLKSDGIDLVCGFSQGRILMRTVNPTEALTFDSGHCLSYRWFIKPENPGCPFSAQCGAFARTAREAMQPAPPPERQ